MSDFEARRIIEALRSGVSSRAVGEYFSSARPVLIYQLSEKLEQICEKRGADGMIISGKYGEGKTHLLNTVFNIAHHQNMVVSTISLSKETPFNNLPQIYAKLLSNTYLPGRLQPGFGHMLQNMTPNGTAATEVLVYTNRQLVTDKLYYLLRAYLHTDDTDEKFLLQADLEGDFIGASALRQIYQRIFSEKMKVKQSFAKTKHMDDYFTMMSYLFLQLGYSGWVLLFDETELIGRLGKKARLNAYKNMASFLFPKEFSNMQAVFSLFALGASYSEDVVEAKHEYENLQAAEFDPKNHNAIEKTLRAIVSASQLQPLNREEILNVFRKVQQFHGIAYGWKPDYDMNEILKKTENRGYLLRTRIRAAVEFLDQNYQYGRSGDLSIQELAEERYDEELQDGETGEREMISQAEQDIEF